MENKENKKGFWATLFAPKQKSSCGCGSQVEEVKEETSGCGCSVPTETAGTCCGGAKEESSCCGSESKEESSCCGSNSNEVSSCCCGSDKCTTDTKEVLVLGPGCAKCKDTFKVVEKVIKQSGLEVKLSKVEDIAEMMNYNIMSTPAVVVDGKVVVKGHVPTEAEVKKALGL